MVSALADPILPIFAIAALGYVLCLRGTFTVDHASIINRFVFNVAGPALIFSVLVHAPLQGLRLEVLGIYMAAELATYVLVAVLAAGLFGAERREAILLGMAASFSNHVFFVRPIAVVLLGDDASQPISGVIVMDVFFFCGSILVTEALSRDTFAVGPTLRSLARNPFVYAPVLAALYRLLGPVAPTGILTFADFVGGAASPASLFSLGVLLATVPLRPVGGPVAVAVMGKLFLHPALFWLAAPAVGASGIWMSSTLLVAAGPCGAMAFVVALQYDVRTDRIAKAVLISTVLSVFTLGYLAQ